jgi:hypothetical protein
MALVLFNLKPATTAVFVPFLVKGNVTMDIVLVLNKASRQDVRRNIFLISATDGSEWPVPRFGRFISEEGAPGTNWIAD